MSERAPYSRVYWTIRADDRLAAVYPDDHHLAAWLRLLIAADMAWPAPADIPASVNRRSLSALESAGVIELRGSLFTFHGLDTERGRRRSAAQESASKRTERIPDGDRTVTGRAADGLLAEPSQDETSRAEPPDPADDYWRVTGKYPTGKALAWIDEMSSKYGSAAVSRSIGRASAISGTTPANLLGRTQDVLGSEARRLSRAAQQAEDRLITERRKSVSVLRAYHNAGAHADASDGECPACREEERNG